MIKIKKILTLTLTFTLLLQIIFLVPQKILGDASQDFNIVDINVWSSAGTAKIYPGSKRVELKVETVYLNGTSAENVVGHLNITFDGFSFSYGSSAYSQAQLLNGSIAKEVSLGTHVTFEYLLDISDDLSPGSYNLIFSLNITYVKEASLTYEVHQNELTIEVSPYPQISLRVVDAYFSPAAYPGSVDTSLYMILENNGDSTIRAAHFNITLPEGFTVKNPRASTGLVNKGDRFTLTFTEVSIPLNVQIEAYNVTVYADFSAQTDDSVSYSNSTSFTVPVMVESPPPEEPIMVANVNTLYNGEPAPLLQSARGVVLRVYLINRLPDTISTIIVNAILPEEITVRGISGTYINGMGPGGTCFVDLTVDVDPEMEIGRHNCSLNVTYLRIASGSSFLMSQTLRFQINVESRHSIIDDNSAIEIVDVRWYEGSVGPYTYGAHLIVLVRNVYIDGLHGAVLELDLPEGIYNSVDNSSRAKATPLSVQLQLSQPLQAQDLAEILNAFLNAQIASPAQVYGRGDILTFMFSLNLFDIANQTYTFEGRLYYIDAWGGNREIQLTVPVTMLGRTEYIQIIMDSSISVRSRYVNTSLTLINCGSAPVYDAYIVVSPYQTTPILIASPAVNYIKKISPQESCQIPLNLAYNPLGFYSQTGGAASITYGPVPFMVSIIYRDISGYSRTFNNSVTVTVEPFIELSIKNIRATGKNASSTVTGIIINYGSTVARCVETQLKIGETEQSSFIGDVDPGSEIAFRIDINKYNETAVLTLKYLNAFNEEETKEINVSITLQEETPSTTPETEQWPLERWIIVAGVIVFLAVSTLIIYRMMKKTKLQTNQ